MWLAYVLPLSERSGLNLKSEANAANITVYEDNLDSKQLDALEGTERYMLLGDVGRTPLISFLAT